MLVKTTSKHEYTASLGDTVANVRVGGATKFIPELLATKFDGEAWLRICHSATVVGGELESFTDGRVDLVVGDVRHSYWVTDGELEHEFGLASKPVSNVLELAVECPSELQWLSQPALTAEQIAQGRHRPDQIVGSYAIYWPAQGNWTGGKQYKTGKICHVKRPKVFDNTGEWTWADLLWEPGGNGGILRVTIDQGWLNAATYPIRVDPTFGWTSAGASSLTIYSEGIYGLEPNTDPASDGTLDSITWWGTYTEAREFTCGIYDVSGVEPNNLLTDGASDEITGDVASTPAEEQTCPYTGSKPTIVASTNYRLALWRGADPATNTYVMYDSDSDNGHKHDSGQTYVGGTMPNPFPGSPTSLGGNDKWSIYGTYTEAAAGGTTNPFSMGAVNLLHGKL